MLSGCSLLPDKDIDYEPREIIMVPSGAVNESCEFPEELLRPFNKNELPVFEQLMCEGRKAWAFKPGHEPRLGVIVNRYNELRQYAEDLTAPLGYVEIPEGIEEPWWKFWR
jgi:hypothetical protein